MTIDTLYVHSLDTLYVHSRDTVFVVPDQATQHYIDILEKTNSQLSLWWNPYGVFIGALGVLFAIAAIIGSLIVVNIIRTYRRELALFSEKGEEGLKVLFDDFKTRSNLALEQLKNKEEHAPPGDKPLIQEEIKEVTKNLKTIDAYKFKRRRFANKPSDIKTNFWRMALGTQEPLMPLKDNLSTHEPSPILPKDDLKKGEGLKDKGSKKDD